MIRYDLKCDQGHDFEAWFPSSGDFEAQSARDLVGCAICGSTKVEKALMAPGVPKKANAGSEAKPLVAAGPNAKIEKMLTALRKEVEANSDYVGDRFAAEARKIHLGESKQRSIYGEATGAEAKSLIEDGVPVAPLPFGPRRDS